MTFTLEQLMAGLPLALTAAFMVVLMLAIAWRRSIDVAFFVTIGGLNIALLSLFLLMRYPFRN